MKIDQISINNKFSPIYRQKQRVSITKMLSNASWLTGARLAGDLASLLLFIILSRHYGPIGIGQYAYGFAIAGLAYSAVNLGFEDYAIRECSQLSLKAKNLLMGRLVGTQIGIAAIVLFAVSCFIAITQPTFEVITIILLLTFYQVVLAFVRTLFVPALSKQAMAYPAISELFCRLFIICATILLVITLKTSLIEALIPFLLGAIILLILAAISAIQHHGTFNLHISWNDAVSLIKSAWPFAASIIVFHIYARADLIMISLILGDDAAGIYAPCLKFLEVGAIPLFFLGLAMYPALSKFFEEDSRIFVEVADKFHRITLIAGGLLAWSLYYLIPMILVPILGYKFSPSVFVIKNMAFLGMVMAVETTAIRLLLSAHLQTSRVKLQFLGTVLNILLNCFMIPIMKINGAVFASIISEIIITIMYFKTLNSRISIKVLIRSSIIFLKILVFTILVSLLLTCVIPYKWIVASSTLVVFCIAILAKDFFSIKSIKKPS